MLRRSILNFCGLVLCQWPLAAANLPRLSPEYVIRLTTGKQLLLSQFRGKVVALMFISTTCPHCQRTCQLVDRLHKEYGPQRVQPFAVAFNENAGMLVPDFIERFKIGYPVGYGTRESVAAYLDYPQSRTFVPISSFIDGKGMIRAQHFGDDEKFYADQEKNFRGLIEGLLRQSAKQPPARLLRQSAAK